MKYGIKYGQTRTERADRLVQNRPHGVHTNINALPRPIISRKYGTPGAHFTATQRYVEDISKLTNAEKAQRNYIVVRSQKYGDRLMWRDFYKISLHDNLQTAMKNMTYRKWRCNCRDTVLKCKHIMAIVQIYRQLRF